MLFVPIKFKTSVQLYPAELDVKYQERLLDKIKEEYEGICSKYGYIRSNSIEIIKRSCGLLQKAYFNGAIRFEVLCRAEVCNPVQGSIVEAIIKNKNQLGILAESYVEMEEHKSPILDIIIPIRSAGKDRKISITGRVVIPENKHMDAVVTEEEEEVDPTLEEEEFVDIPADDDTKKEGGGDDEDEEKEEEEEDDDDASSLMSEEDEEYDEDFQEDMEDDADASTFLGGGDDD